MRIGRGIPRFRDERRSKGRGRNGDVEYAGYDFVSRRDAVRKLKVTSGTDPVGNMRPYRRKSCEFGGNLSNFHRRLDSLQSHTNFPCCRLVWPQQERVQRTEADAAAAACGFLAILCHGSHVAITTPRRIPLNSRMEIIING